MNNVWYIMGIRDNIPATIAVVLELEYYSEWMGDEYVTTSVKSSEPIDWHFGDWIVYRGETFTINYDPNVVKKARRGTYGEGFVYDNVKQYSLASGMKSIDMKDVVLSDNQMTYTSLSAFSFFADSVEDLADRIQANLNRNATGWRVLTPSLARCNQRGVDTSDWSSYFSSDGIRGERDVNIDVTEEQRCWDVLKFSYEKFGLTYFVKDMTVVIGGDAIMPGEIFRYGKGKGLYEIERTSNEDQEIVTRLYAYGSSRNIPSGYYANVGSTAFLRVTENNPASYDDDGLSIVLERVSRFDLLTKVYYAMSNIKHGSVVVSAGGVVMDGYVETIKSSDGYTFRLLASTNKSKMGYPDSEYATPTTREILDAFKQHCSVGSEILFVSGISKNKMPSDHVHVVTDTGALMVNKLMLPGFPSQSLRDFVAGDAELAELLMKYDFSSDPKDPWIASYNAGIIGSWEGIVNFDGNQQKEIYPTIEGFDNTVPGGGAPFISDNGVYEGESVPTFTLTVGNLFDFDEAYGSRLEDVYIEMKDGWCVGRRFKVTGVKKAVDRWQLTCERDYDDVTQRWYPYNYYNTNNMRLYQINVGDHYVVTGIPLPDEYVRNTAKRMLIAACGYLDKRDHVRYTYLPKIDEIYMARQHDVAEPGTSYHDTLHAGMQFQFEDANDLGINRVGSASPYIDVLTIKENGNNGIPTYDMVLRDEKEKGSLEKISESVSELKGAQAIVERRTTIQEYIGEYSLRFYRSDGNPWGEYIFTRRTNINIVINPILWCGGVDISENVLSWRWERIKDGAVDPLWPGSDEREITITVKDLPTSWNWQNPAAFECVALINDGNEDIEISAQIGFK